MRCAVLVSTMVGRLFHSVSCRRNECGAPCWSVPWWDVCFILSLVGGMSAVRRAGQYHGGMSVSFCLLSEE